MDPIIGGLISAGGSIFSSLMNANQSAANQRTQIEANQDMFNAQSAFTQNMVNQQQAFQQYNSNTAYERAVQDMQKAGLNPAMMFGSGSAASTPSGSVGSAPDSGKALPGVSSAAGGVGGAIDKAISTATALRTADATVNNLVEQNAKIKAEALTESRRPLLVDAETGNLAATTKLKDISVSDALRDAAKADAETPFYKSEAGKLAVQLGLGGRNVNDIVSPISNLVSSARSWSSMNNARLDRGRDTVGGAFRDSFSDRFNSIYGRSN